MKRALILVALVAATPVAAAERPAVHVDAAGCGGHDGALAAMVGLELGARLVDAPAAGVTSLYVACGADTASLRLDDPVTAKVSARTIDVPRAAPYVRARLVALAAAELVKWSWAEIDAEPEHRPPPAPAVTVEAQAAVRRSVEAQRPRPLTVVVVADGRAFGRGMGFLPGGGASLRYGDTLTLLADVLGHAGSRRVSAGAVDATLVTGGAALAWSFRHAGGSTSVGAGARVGIASFAGEPAAGGDALVGHAIRGVWAAPFAVARIELGRVQAVRIAAALEVGHVARRYAGTVPGARAFAIAGPFAALQVGVGVGR